MWLEYKGVGVCCGNNFLTSPQRQDCKVAVSPFLFPERTGTLGKFGHTGTCLEPIEISLPDSNARACWKQNYPEYKWARYVFQKLSEQPETKDDWDGRVWMDAGARHVPLAVWPRQSLSLLAGSVWGTPRPHCQLPGVQTALSLGFLQKPERIWWEDSKELHTSPSVTEEHCTLRMKNSNIFGCQCTC